MSRETVTEAVVQVRELLTKHAENVRRCVEDEIEATERRLRQAAQAFINRLKDEGRHAIEEAFKQRDSELENLLAVVNDAMFCQDDKKSVAELLEKLDSQKVYFVTLKEMSSYYKVVLHYYGMHCAVEALQDSERFYGKDVIEFSRHPGYLPTLDRCFEFFNSAQLGTVKCSSPIKRIREILSGKQSFDSSPFKHLSQPLPGATIKSFENNKNLFNCNFMNRFRQPSPCDFIGKSFYSRMKLVNEVKGKDAAQWEIRKPFGNCFVKPFCFKVFSSFFL